jgi:phosphoribosylformylglycinamidine cyclo-ligase
LLKQIGNVPDNDWRRTFNLGIGMIFVIAERDLSAAAKILKRLKEPWYRIGRVARGSGVAYE